MTQPQVLIVENDLIATLDLEVYLRSLGYSVAAAAMTGEEALESAERLKPDVVLMDIRLEGNLDGIQTAAGIRRERNVPVIFLTALSDNETIEQAVQTEPCGYLIKPFDERELAAALRLALHRSKTSFQDFSSDGSADDRYLTAGAETPKAIRIGRLRLDLDLHRAFHGDTEITLTKKEFDLLKCFARRPGTALSAETILTEVWGPQFGHYVQTLRVHLGNLRKKIGPAAGCRIEAVRGVGYRLVLTPEFKPWFSPQAAPVLR